jgi:hypothetical protein
VSRLRRWYGAGPLHALATVVAALVSGYALTRFGTDAPWVDLGLWFVGSVVLHDLVLAPLYALADRSLLAVLRHRRPATGAAAPAVPVVNHLRVPALLSGLLLLLWAPLVLRLTEGYEPITGEPVEVYLPRWLGISAVLFAGSAVVYALRLRRAARRRRS